MKWRGGHISEATIKARQSGPVTIIGNGTARTIRLKAGKAKRVKW
jgi:hypothetical protein